MKALAFTYSQMLLFILQALVLALELLLHDVFCVFACSMVCVPSCSILFCSDALGSIFPSLRSIFHACDVLLVHSMCFFFCSNRQVQLIQELQGIVLREAFSSLSPL